MSIEDLPMKAVRRSAGIATLAMAGLVGACSPPDQVAVYNNSGQSILLRLAPSLYGPQWSTEIAPGERSRHLSENMAPPGLVIEVGGCVLGYDLPPVDEDYRTASGSRAPIHSIQVEPDLTVVLLPAKAGPTPVVAAGGLPLQRRYGYPVRPLFRKCGEAAGWLLRTRWAEKAT